MSADELQAMLEETGFPVEQDFFEKPGPPSVPYVTHRLIETQNFYADNEIFFQKDHIEVELCTEFRSPQDEKRLTDALDRHKIRWEKTSDMFLIEEELFSIIYEFYEGKRT